MEWRIPDPLKNEIGHYWERLRHDTGRVNPREWVNSRPVLVLGVTAVCVVLLGGTLVRVRWPAPDRAFQGGKQAWFYDMNTRQLFVGSRKKIGPIKAPSGPTPDGEPAGLRAHVYSYVLDPNETELSVGFLERPDPYSAAKPAHVDIRDFDKWARGRVLRRPDDKQWVQVTSPEGHAIIEEMTRPNKKGRTPMYQVPK